MKVIGAGLGRTGTASLKLALEQLLGGPCHHMFEVQTPADCEPWHRAAEGDMPDWAEVLSGYEALVDWPGASFWPELAQAFPDALVLLSVRDLDKWYESASSTIFRTSNGKDDDGGLGEARRAMFAAIMVDRFPVDLTDPGATKAQAKHHNEAVIAGVAPERLLVYKTGDGWEPICEALGLPVPDEPFPHSNTRKEFLERFSPTD